MKNFTKRNEKITKISAPNDELRLLVHEWAAKIRVKIKEIHLRKMSAKWASLSSSGRITLNIELIGLPKRLVDYVIVHELVHLLAPNHGKIFKSFMLAYLPNWEIYHQEIQKIGKDY
jgi:predicted metal-dependent hydrolase